MVRAPARVRAKLDAAYLWLGLILLLALFLRLRYFFGVVRWDSFDYADLAVGLLRGEAVFGSQANPIHAPRLAITLPLAAAYALWGINESFSALWPLIASLGSIVVVYYLGRTLFGPRAGLLAALVLALYPLEIIYATHLLPDAIAPFFLSLAALFFLRGVAAAVPYGPLPLGDERARRAGGPTNGRIQGRPRFGTPWYFLLSGVFLGLAYYTRLNSPMLLLFFALYLLARRQWVPAVLWTVPGLGLVFFAAGLVFWAYGGGFFYDWTNSYAPLFAPENKALFTSPTDLASYYAYAKMMLTSPYLGYWPHLFLLGAGYLAWRKQQNLSVPLLWFGSLYLYLEMLSQYPVVSLPEKGDRMLLVLSAPLALTLGAFWADLLRGLAGWLGRLTSGGTAPTRLVGLLGPGAAPMLAVALLIYAVAAPPLAKLPALQSQLRNWIALDPRTTAEVLRTLPPKPVYLTTNWLKGLNLFLGYPRDDGGQALLRRTAYDARGTPIGIADAYVVHDKGIAINRPKAWQEVAQVNERVVVYYAPAEAAAEGAVVTFEAENLRGVTPDKDYELDKIQGWASYSMPFYSAGKAAIAKNPGAVMWRRGWYFPPGHYRVSLQVYDYGNGGMNKVEVWLNGATQEVRWWDSRAGLRTVSVTLSPEIYGDILAVTSLQNGQGYIVVDAISVEPAAEPSPGPTRGPLMLEAEGFEGIEARPHDDYAHASGWTSYPMSFYSRGRAAITKAVGGVLRAPIPALAAGDYRITVAVYDYANSGINQIEVTLNGVRQALEWSGGPPGVRRLAADFRATPGGEELTIKALRNGQGYIIIDAVWVEPL